MASTRVPSPSAPGVESSGISSTEATAIDASLYAAFFDKAPEALLILSDSEKIEEANRAALVLLGADKGQLRGRSISDFVAPEGAPRDGAGLGLRHCEQTSGELRLTRADGRVRLLEFSAAPHFAPERHLLILRDVTEQRVGEKIRRDAERELKSVLDNVDAIISRYDRDLRFIYTNLHMKRVTGIAPYSVIGKRLDELPFPPGDVDEWNTNLRQVIESGNALWRETFTASNPVGFQYFESSLTPEFDVEGRVISVLSISRNISKRKSIEETKRRADEEVQRLAADLTDSKEQLRHQTALHQLVLDQMAEGIAICDASGRMVYLNRAARQIFPQDFGTLEEWPRAFGLFLPDQVTPYPPADLPLAHAILGKAADAVEIFVRNSNDQTFWLTSSARPVFDDSGKLRCAVTVLHDVTEAREAERKLEQAAADVRRKAEQLERSNADLEQFAYVASHDLKEPLRMVSSYVQLLERRYRTSLDDDARQFIDFAVDGARRMYTLLDELLRYYRAGKHERSLVAVDSTDLVEQVVHELSLHCAETSGEITHGPLPRVLGDPPQLRQLFYNLFENAIKFRGEAPPRVRVEAERTGEEWLFRVSDNGVGLENATPERVFGIFQRLHRRDNLTGTGIGLAVCRRIVTRHGGRIGFESERGVGTTFTFTLPASDD